MAARQLSKTSSSQYVSQWMVASQTELDKEYKVSQKTDGTFSCSCPRWIFGKPKKDCKHIIGLKAEETQVDTVRTEAHRKAVKAARAGVIVSNPVAEPVFLLQTKRKIILLD